MPREDDAFSWEGDDDPTLVQGAEEPERPAAARADDASGATQEAPGSAPDGGAPAAVEAGAGDDPPPRRMGDVALVAVGVLGGVYALWTAGWVGSVLRLRALTGGDAMFFASAVLAVLAPAIWFTASWALTRRRPVWARFAALLAGAVVLAPWPFLMLGAVGA